MSQNIDLSRWPEYDDIVQHRLESMQHGEHAYFDTISRHEPAHVRVQHGSLCMSHSVFCKVDFNANQWRHWPFS